MEKYRKLAYLLGCYMIIADREINSLELDVLEKYLPLESDDELMRQRKAIFSDTTDKQDLAGLLSDLRLLTLTLPQKQEIITLLADIAYGDNYLAARESLLLDQVIGALHIDAKLIVKESEERAMERLHSLRLSGIKRTIGKVENFIYDLFFQDRYKTGVDLLLGSLGYAASVEKITDTALVDLERVTHIVVNINDLLVATNDSISQLKIARQNASKEVIAVADAIDKVKEHFDSLITNSIKETQEALEKKRRNIRHFTIAFMGRTKSGKSTLHKVITQQEADDIGSGQQRTTRFNRSWYWNRLRVVDTPGIGAPGGATDTDIAKSIIDEADVICYIVTSDSIQETEFDFFETIKEHNKPLYIILNVKSNLGDRPRLDRFLKSPDAWRSSTGSKSIQGHLDRIHERLDGKYNMNSVEIIPIHLLAAQMGFFPATSKENAKILREASNIFQFTRSVKAAVHKTGTLKKSLSVIDGTAYQMHQIALSLGADLKQIKEAQELLVKKFKELKPFMQEEQTRLEKDIQAIFSCAKTELHNRASSFAGENYDNSDAGALWAKDQTVRSIFSRMNTKIQHCMEDYNDRVRSQIEEFIADVRILDSFCTPSSVVGGRLINMKLGVSILGTFLSLAIPFILPNVWNPGGWILLGASLIVSALSSFFASLFTSKAEKIRKATEKMRRQLIEEIDKGLAENQRDFLNQVKNVVGTTTDSIFNLFEIYIDGTSKIIGEIDYLCQQITTEESAVNTLVSFRLLEHVGKMISKDVYTLDNKTLSHQYPVDRDWSRQLITYRYKVSLTDRDIEKITQATQMNIAIK